MKKKLSLVLFLSLMLITVSSLVNAATNDIDLPVPTPGAKVKIINYAYDPYVLNVATDSTPVSSDNVTTWSWSNNWTQWWKNTYKGLDNYGNTCYGIALQDSDLDYLGLNFNQATTKCTIYSFALNSPEDYRISWQTGVYGYIIGLKERDRFLGSSGSSLGSQCYWYYGAIYGSDNWLLYSAY